MDFEQLKFFISAAVLNNFSAAAAENSISQSAFSKQIKSLEDEIHAELFERRGRTVQLTTAGECFLNHAYAIVGSYNNMKNDMARFNGSNRIVIKLSSISVMPQYGITDAIMEFCSLHKRIAFDIVEAESAVIYNSLCKLNTDFGIVRTDDLDTNKYNAIPLAEDRLCAVIGDSHRLKSRESVFLRELKSERLIFPTELSATDTICMEACQKAGFTPNIAFRISGRPDTAFALVSQQQAILLAFEKVMHYYPMDGCRIIPLSDNITSTTALIWLKMSQLNSTCRSFKDYMAARDWQKA